MQTTTRFQLCLDQMCYNYKSQQINMLCGCGYMLIDQQGCAIKPIGLTNQLEGHKTQKWWSSQTYTWQSWVYIDMNDRL